MAHTPKKNRWSMLSRRSTPLADIPEASPAPSPPSPPRPAPTRTVTPGPNAFAQQAERIDKHRLESNAFYQQAMQRCDLTPPTANLPGFDIPLTAIHPAFRPGFDINAPVARSSNSAYSDAALTTMSPFIHTQGQTPPTPPMLLPRDCVQAYPTDRGFIEDRREQLKHENSGNDTERTPVFIHTPKDESSEFSNSTPYATPKKKVSIRESSTAIEQPKTPKKTLLEKLRLSTPRSSQAATSTTSLGTNRGYGVYGGGENLPPKAKAVLSTAPLKSALARAPSKKKGLFSFKSSDRPSLETHKSSPAYIPSEPRIAGAQTVSFSDSAGKTPQTAHSAFSDPSYDRYIHSKRALSQAHSDQGGRIHSAQNKQGSASGVSRTRSLQYIDRTVPPTPPAKNTPPHEKESRAMREARLGEESRAILEHHRVTSEQRRFEMMRNITPKKKMVQTPQSKLKSPLRQDMFDDISPAREGAKLLGADGRTSPTKFGSYGHRQVPKLVKQPSVYSMHASFYPDLNDEHSFEEIKRRADGLGLEGLTELPESFYNSDPRVTYSPSLYSEDFGTRSSVIQQSPSMLHQMDIATHLPSLHAVLERHRPKPGPGVLSEKPSASSQGTIPLVYPDLAKDPSRQLTLKEALQMHRSTSEIELPVHSRTQSPSLSESNSRNHSPQKSALEVVVKALGDDDTPLSPANYNCPSAKPSPLNFLPNTTYAQKRKLNLNVDIGPESPSSITTNKTITPSRSRGRIETFKSTGSPMAHFSTTPFDNLPTLSPGIKPKFGAMPSTAESEEQLEPQEQDLMSFSTSNTEDSVKDQKIDEDESNQDTPEQQRQKIRAHQLREYKDEIARLQQEEEEFRATIAQIQAQRKPSPVVSTKTLIHEQLALIASFQQELDEHRARIARFQALHPREPTLGGATDNNAAHASSAANVNVSEHGIGNNDKNNNEENENETIAPFVEEGSLSQMGLYHRVRQQRVDQEYDDAQIADLERHGKSKKDGIAPSAEAMGEVMSMFEMLAEKVKQLELNAKK